eukprot:7119173-Prymnesium_polylepis.1
MTRTLATTPRKRHANSANSREFACQLLPAVASCCQLLPAKGASPGAPVLATSVASRLPGCQQVARLLGCQ